MKFENEIAEELFKLNIDLNNDMQRQAEALLALHTSFDMIDWDKLRYLDKKRLESVKCWCTTALENINSFNLQRMKEKVSQISPENDGDLLKIDELKVDLNKISSFMVEGMEDLF